MSCHDWAALPLWFLGRPDSALAHATQAHELATVHPYSLASAQAQLAYLHQYRGEPAETLRWAGSGPWPPPTSMASIRAAQADILGGWARSAGRAGDCTEQLRSGLATYLGTGAELDHPYYLGLPATPSASPGTRPRGWRWSSRRSSWSPAAPSTTCPSCTSAWGRPGPRPAARRQAADAYELAMELAAENGARSPELRAARARRCRLPGARPERAHDRLRELYGGFEEASPPPICGRPRAWSGR